MKFLSYSVVIQYGRNEKLNCLTHIHFDMIMNFFIWELNSLLVLRDNDRTVYLHLAILYMIRAPVHTLVNFDPPAYVTLYHLTVNIFLVLKLIPVFVRIYLFTIFFSLRDAFVYTVTLGYLRVLRRNLVVMFVQNGARRGTRRFVTGGILGSFTVFRGFPCHKTMNPLVLTWIKTYMLYFPPQ